MAFRVEIQPQAFEDLDRIVSYIAAQSSALAAERWFRGIMDAISSLSSMPARCAIAPESPDLGQEVRVLFHGHRNRAYKIFFAIRYKTPATGAVIVFHVRHWARKPVDREEFEGLIDDVE